MPYPYDAPRPRSRLGAAVHSFFHPNEAYRLGQRTLSAEREADYYARSARSSEERAMSAEYERNRAEYDAEYNAHLADREHQRRSQAQRSTHEYGRRNLQRGYQVGYRDGSVDMHHAASGQRRVGSRRVWDMGTAIISLAAAVNNVAHHSRLLPRIPVSGPQVLVLVPSSLAIGGLIALTPK
ncbi:MAG: hypothetical protein Q9215_007276, partial [Flavoplaca cf. flavocitrina]